MKSKQKSKRTPPKRKNVSQCIKNGTVLKTRDEFFQDHNGYIKPKYQNNNILYRDVTVVDSNRRNELAVIKHQSSGTYYVYNRAGQKQKYAPYIKTKDNEGQPIKLGDKFKIINIKFHVDERKANRMKKNSIRHRNINVSNSNKIALKDLKGRKK